MQIGSKKLTGQLEAELRAKGRVPYVIPVGGSNALGTWGYLECMNEILEQTHDSDPFTDIFVVRLLPLDIRLLSGILIGLWQWGDSGWVGTGDRFKWIRYRIAFLRRMRFSGILLP